MKNKIIFFTFAIYFCLTCSIVFAQTEKPKGPISISADYLEADENIRKVNFKGNVIARQDDLTISCDQMEVYYLESNQVQDKPQTNNPAQNQQIDKIECNGAVKINENEKMAIADKATYLAALTPRKIILTGNARLWQGKDSISGHQVTYYLDDNRSVVESRTNRRVRATYH